MPIDVRKVIQELVVPELQGIRSDIKVTHSEIKRLDEKIDSLEKRYTSGMESLRNELNATREEFRSRFNSLDFELKTAISIHERIAAIEAKIGR